MAKIITDPLKAGAKSKIYLLAYPEPITGYAIGKRLRPGIGIPPTARIYNNLKEMIHDDDRLIIKTNDKNLSKTEPLLNAIKKEFEDKKITLSGDDVAFLDAFLDTPFRRFMKNTIKSMDVTQDVSAYQILTQGLGGFAYAYTVYTDKVKERMEMELGNYEPKKNTTGGSRMAIIPSDIFDNLNISDALITALMTFAPPYIKDLSQCFTEHDPGIDILFKS